MKTLRNGPRPGDAPFTIRAGADNSVDVLLYDAIGGWDGILAKDFVPQLNAIKAATIHVRVNSPGGDVFEGITIANALKAHPANVVVHIDGLAASIASIIALAGDEVRMAENAFLMIHNPWTFAIGNAADFRKTADTLDTIAGALIDTYVKKTGAPRADVIAWMDEETWLNAEDALAEGFVDAVDSADAEGEAIAARFDLSVFAKTPAELHERRAKIAAAATTRRPRAGSLSTATEPMFAVGDRVKSLVDHMPGMKGMAGAIAEANAGSPPYYAVNFDEPMGEGNPHKWLSEDEIEAASEDGDSHQMRRSPAPTKRTIERALREAGCSRTHAKAVAALADKALAQRDAGDDGAGSTDAAVLAAIDSIIASTK